MTTVIGFLLHKLLQLGLTIAALGVCGLKHLGLATSSVPTQRYQPTAETAEQIYIPNAEDVAFAMLIEGHHGVGFFVVADRHVFDRTGARAMPFVMPPDSVADDGARVGN